MAHRHPAPATYRFAVARPGAELSSCDCAARISNASTISKMPRNSASRPAQMIRKTACARNDCAETQKPMKTSSSPPMTPNHHASLRTLAGDRGDDVHRAGHDEQDAQDRRKGPERPVGCHERPDRGADEQDAEQGVRPPPAGPDRCDHELLHCGEQEQRPEQEADGRHRGDVEAQDDDRDDDPGDPCEQECPPRPGQPPGQLHRPGLHLGGASDAHLVPPVPESSSLGVTPAVSSIQVSDTRQRDEAIMILPSMLTGSAVRHP